MSDILYKKGDLDYLMSKARRKQIPLCRECHMKYHGGNLIIPKEIMDKYNHKNKK
jgi:hypothetical protein